ncbi:MAG: ComEC/Rec2 family competence protein [Lachnospiraceae bacterium]
MKAWKACLQYAAICLFGISFTMGRVHQMSLEKIPVSQLDDAAIELTAKGCSTAGGGEEKMLGGGRITMLATQTGVQMMSFVIETPGGQLIVVDGGTEGDAAHLQETILAKGGRVSAWLITHPHYDHVGALHSILNQPKIPIAIDHIYYSFADPEWYHSVGDGQADLAGVLCNDFKRLPAASVHGDIHKGQEIKVGDVKIRVLNSRYHLNQSPVNNSSIVYDVEMSGKHIIFLGDLCSEGGEKLIREVGAENLKCDILQMAHHGQQGLNERAYRILRPSVCMWPTPGWLWDNDSGGGPGSGPWHTLLTREWMEKLEVEKHYIMKDGDQVIE